VLAVNLQEPSWMDDIRGFLKENILLENDAAADVVHP
jgi:hypothetical protein